MQNDQMHKDFLTSLGEITRQRGTWSVRGQTTPFQAAGVVDMKKKTRKKNCLGTDFAISRLEC